MGIRSDDDNEEQKCKPAFQVSSYGGFLEFTLRYVPKPGAEEPSDGEALVELNVIKHSLAYINHTVFFIGK